MPDIHYAVVAHVDRHDKAAALASLVSATIHWDDGTLGAWGNHRAAIAAGLATDATHIVELEDDAVPVEDFANLVEQAIALKPLTTQGGANHVLDINT